jgi:putative endonuclease
MLLWLRKLLGFKTSVDAAAGARGERLAEEWLRRERGFVVVARNWRSPRDRRDEIDLVCRDGGALVFVEVKARAAGALVPGYHAVDARKKRVLRRAAEVYLRRLPEKPATFRLDVVEVAFPAADSAASPEISPVRRRGASSPAFRWWRSLIFVVIARSAATKQSSWNFRWIAVPTKPGSQ